MFASQVIQQYCSLKIRALWQRRLQIKSYRWLLINIENVYTVHWSCLIFFFFWQNLLFLISSVLIVNSSSAKMHSSVYIPSCQLLWDMNAWVAISKFIVNVDYFNQFKITDMCIQDWSCYSVLKKKIKIKQTKAALVLNINFCWTVWWYLNKLFELMPAVPSDSLNSMFLYRKISLLRVHGSLNWLYLKIISHSSVWWDRQEEKFWSCFLY